MRPDWGLGVECVSLGCQSTGSVGSGAAAVLASRKAAAKATRMEAVRAVTAFRKRATLGALDAAVTAQRSSAVVKEEGRHGYWVNCARAGCSDGAVKHVCRTCRRRERGRWGGCGVWRELRESCRVQGGDNSPGLGEVTRVSDRRGVG
jgi:hypothetical protein